MADEFDALLRQSLAPAPREADRAFVARVQTGIMLEERLQAERTALAAKLLREIVAVLSLAMAMLWLSRSPYLSGVLNDSPAIVLGVLIALFAFLIFVLSVGSGSASRRFSTR